MWFYFPICGEWHNQKLQWPQWFFAEFDFSFNLSLLSTHSYVRCTLFTLKFFSYTQYASMKSLNFQHSHFGFFISIHSVFFFRVHALIFGRAFLLQFYSGFCETFSKVQWILLTLIWANKACGSCWLFTSVLFEDEFGL